MRKYFSAFIFLIVIGVTGCRDERESLPPVILLEQQLYETVVGETVTVTPEYENCGEGTAWLWTCDGETLSVEESLTFTSDEAGEYYIMLSVSNSAGEDKAELRIDVYGMMPPEISLPGAVRGFSVLQDSLLVLAPEISSALPVTYSWTIDGKTVSTDSVYTFPTGETGTFEAGLCVENRDGRDEIEFTVEVMSPGEAFSWTFDRTEYGISSGRSLLLRPQDIEYPFDAVYTWSVDGTEVQSGESSEYVFDLTAEGSYTVSVTMRNSYTAASQDLTVTVLPAEGTYFRAADASSNASISKVYEYTRHRDSSSTTESPSPPRKKPAPTLSSGCPRVSSSPSGPSEATSSQASTTVWRAARTEASICRLPATPTVPHPSRVSSG